MYWGLLTIYVPQCQSSIKFLYTFTKPQHSIWIKCFKIHIFVIYNVAIFAFSINYGHHDVQISCAINQPLLAHHWRVHQCLLTLHFIAPSIPWGVSAPGGKTWKQLLKDHNFLNNSPILIDDNSTFDIFGFQKTLHTIHFDWKNCFAFGERYLTP